MEPSRTPTTRNLKAAAARHHSGRRRPDRRPLLGSRPSPSASPSSPSVSAYAGNRFSDARGSGAGLHLAPPRTQGSAAACVRPAPILHDHGRVRISDLRSVRGERGCPVRAPVHGWLVLLTTSTWGGMEDLGRFRSCACAAPRAHTGCSCTHGLSISHGPCSSLCGLCCVWSMQAGRVLHKCENSASPRDVSLCGILGGHYWTVPLGHELMTLDVLFLKNMVWLSYLTGCDNGKDIYRARYKIQNHHLKDFGADR